MVGFGDVELVWLGVFVSDFGYDACVGRGRAVLDVGWGVVSGSGWVDCASFVFDGVFVALGEGCSPDVGFAFVLGGVAASCDFVGADGVGGVVAVLDWRFEGVLIGVSGEIFGWVGAVFEFCGYAGDGAFLIDVFFGAGDCLAEFVVGAFAFGRLVAVWEGLGVGVR